VAAVSFFVAQIVIPDKNAGAPRAAPAEKPRAVQAEEDIPVVVAGNTPVETPIIPRETMTAAVAAKAAPPAPDAKVIPPVAKTAPATPAPAAQPARPDTAQKPKPQKPATGLNAENITVCTGVQDRMPVGASDRFTKDTRQLYFYTQITGARDTTIVTHRWYHNGKLVQIANLPIRSSFYRTHSKRNMQNPDVPDPTGSWRVDVVETNTGRLMGSTSFTVVD
jgi:hypothetical protein